MGLAIGLGVGVGLLLIWLSLTSAPTERRQDDARPGRLADLLSRAGLESTSPSQLVVVCGVCAVAAALLVQLLSRTATVAIAFGLLAGYLPVALLTGRARRRQRELLDVWPEAVDNLASAVRAGLSLPEALSALGRRGPEPLRPHFDAFATDYQLTGRFGESLDRLKERLADPVGDRVVEGLRVAREVGGGELGGVLRNLSGFLRDDARTRSELESRQTWTVVGARLAVAAPWLVLLMLSFQREVIGRYASPEGALVLAFGGGLSVVAYRLMVRIGRLPVERRVLS
ncbi:type II secretion system F family protein [Nocardioides iriomotensis]|uniref:Type II secretion system protein F n=1 Tax=Nocardioides iriomotensis TaxID=715784 RepID=A0A4Q5J5N6_9ACTN|nr:type II secretion system F family protein [Nocardioides iriomotensis]RYU12891.1 type II secretion system protein F [Nocardioides iriomotensis]